jgi:serine/threonine protein phosphatase PrpC
MDYVKACLSTIKYGPGDAEFGNLWQIRSPLTFGDIRERSVWSDQPLSLLVGRRLVRYAFLSQRGYYPDDLEKENQDAFLILPNFNGRAGSLLVGVFDGHGEFGDDLSQYVRDNLESVLSEALRKHSDFTKAVDAAYISLNTQMQEEMGEEAEASGTTAVVTLFEDGVCWTANVGDSRAIIGSLVDEKMQPTALSTDHNPFRKDERDRIRECGGEILSVRQRRQNMLVPDEFWDSVLPKDEKMPAPRVWKKGNEGPGCAFTRSLGDKLGESVGVIATPEVVRTEIQDNHKFVCLASDGVWEFVTNDAVCKLISSFDDPLAAARAVVAEAYMLWMTMEGRNTDDITVVVMLLDDDAAIL